MKVSIKKPEEVVNLTPLEITVGEKQKQVHIISDTKEVLVLRTHEREIAIPLSSWDQLVDTYYKFYHGEGEE